MADGPLLMVGIGAGTVEERRERDQAPVWWRERLLLRYPQDTNLGLVRAAECCVFMFTLMLMLMRMFSLCLQ